jgi:hypothetical protein
MRKELELSDHFPKTGEPTVRLAAFTRRHGGLSIEKVAFAESQSPLYDFLTTIQPEVDQTFLLVNAIGAYETYDDNRNGDGFNEFAYKIGTRATCGHPDCTKAIDGWINGRETLVEHYKTFEEFAGIYQHHVNKDPSKSLGKVQKAIWNARMHRTELLLKVNNKKEPSLIQRVGSGDFPAVSMGCHVKWDVCSICGHRAPTRAQYCDHALRHMREIFPDGRKVCVLNPSPRFFDISFVFRPADPTGWTMQKVAREHVVLSSRIGEVLDQQEAIAISFMKVAEEIDTSWRGAGPLGRYVQSLSPTSVDTPTFDEKLLARVYPQGEVIKSAAEKNALAVSDDVVDRLTLATPALVALLGRFPGTFKTAVYGDVGDVLRERAFAPWDGVDLDIGPGAHHRAAEPGRTELLSITDPYTGHVYQTTRGTAMDASRQDVKTKLLNTAILSALYTAGLHHVLGGKIKRTALALPVAALMAQATNKALVRAFPPYRNPEYLTDQGIPVSGGTAFKEAAITPHHWAQKLASDAGVHTDETVRDALCSRILTGGGGLFLKWASLPISAQVNTLTHGATKSASAYAVSDLDLASLADNLLDLLTHRAP